VSQAWVFVTVWGRMRAGFGRDTSAARTDTGRPATILSRVVAASSLKGEVSSSARPTAAA
jgi:hypothetical protein